MRNFFLIVVILICLKVDAQQKISFEIDGSVLKSIGKNITSYHHSTTNRTLTYVYYSRLKYEKTYFNLLALIQYKFTPSLSIGFESGIYFHLEEKYYTDIQENTISIPIRVVLSSKIFEINSKPLGIQLAGGPLYFDIQNNYARLHNGMTYNTCIFYNVKEKRRVAIAVEQEVDNNTFYFHALTPDFKNESYEFKLKRLSLTISYRYIF